MAERRNQECREVRLDYAFDRLFTAKLQQAYEILVLDQVRLVAAGAIGAREDHEDRRDLRPVSSDQQKDDNTIASQTAALIDFARSHG